MRRRFFLTYNPTAGRDRRHYIEAVVDALLEAGAEIVRSQAIGPGAACAEATAAARSGDFDAILAAGGDGTVRQAAVAVLGTSCPVGAVMMGTGNVLAHELGLPRAPLAIAGVLIHGPTIDIELASANGEPFLLMAGVGFDARVVGGLDQTWKQRFARAAYGPATLSALSRPLDKLQVTIDGVEHACAWAVVTSAARYGGSFLLTRQTSIRVPGLVAMLFRARSRAELVAQAMCLARGDLDRRAALDPDWVTTIPCTAADIHAAGLGPKHAPIQVPVQIDGDVCGTTPVHIRAGSGRVSLIVAT